MCAHSQPDEQPPIGIILGAGKKQEQIELLKLGKSGLHVAECLTVLRCMLGEFKYWALPYRDAPCTDLADADWLAIAQHHGDELRSRRRQGFGGAASGQREGNKSRVTSLAFPC